MAKESTQYSEPEKTYTAIRDWIADERPRERLARLGAASLSDSELLAILIKSGSRGYSAVDAARDLLNKKDGLDNLATCDYSEFKSVKGLGEAKAITLAAAFELGRRIKAVTFENESTIRSPEDLAAVYIPRLRGERIEKFITVLLNSSNQIFREHIVSTGSLNASIVHPREVFRLAVTDSAASVIFIHNHPSGNKNPSEEDISITKQLKSAGEILNIKVLDHLIIAGDSFTSLASLGYL